jgi:hypothetical protein
MGFSVDNLRDIFLVRDAFRSIGQYQPATLKQYPE